MNSRGGSKEVAVGRICVRIKGGTESVFGGNCIAVNFKTLTLLGTLLDISVFRLKHG